MSAAIAEARVSSALQGASGDGKKTAGDGAQGGDPNLAVSGARGLSVTDGPPSGANRSSTGAGGGQAKNRRRVVIDEEDEDDQPPPVRKSAGTSFSAGGPRGAAPVGGGRAMSGSSRGSGSLQNGNTSAKTSRDGSSGGSSSGPRKWVSAGNAFDSEEDELPLTALATKGTDRAKANRTAPGASGTGTDKSRPNGGARNGVKKSSFEIPKREAGASSSARPASAAGSSPKVKAELPYSPGGRSGAGAKEASVGGGRYADRGDDFQSKSSKPKKRPIDNGDRHLEDPGKPGRHARKLEEDQERAREEARKKRKREQEEARRDTNMKVKQEPGRGGTAAGSRDSGRASSSQQTPPSVRDQKPRKFKEMTRAEKIERAMKVYKWWEEPPKKPGIQWDSLEHNGAHFAPEYQPHGVKLKYDGKEVHLAPHQEEVATFYAGMPLDGPQLAEQGVVFNKNFFEDFKSVLDKGHKIKDFRLLDFSAIRAHLDTAKQIKRAATDGEKAAAKTVKEELAHKYGYAIVDDHLEKVGNYNVEPPGLFRGRGKHPKTGKLKARVFPCAMAINCAETASVPRCSVAGYAWQTVQHDPSVTWLAKWDGDLAGTKYMMLAASSSFKGMSDMAKYDKAMKLMGFIDKIREDYTRKLDSSDARTKQIATAVWIIDKLALRVGGEKGEDEADTVGCCSLRVEHVRFPDPDSHSIDLEFLGKDSMLFKQTIDFDVYGGTGLKVFRNLQSFWKGKKKSEDIFNWLDPTILNQHLQSLMPGLTAKVFRTYNASATLQNELPGEEALAGLSVAEKVALYNGANREVAILCNHQRTVSSAQKEGLEKLQDRLDMLKRQKQDLKQMLVLAKKKKASSIKLKSSDKSADEAASKAAEKAKAARTRAVTDEEKVAATRATELANELKKKATKAKAESAHLFGKTPSEESIMSRIKNWGEKIKKLQIDIRDRDDNKEVSLSTSKINYMDPRVSIAWCKRHEVPVEKVFAKTLREKFVWAMNVPPNWEFSYGTIVKATKSKSGVKRPASAVAAKSAPSPGRGASVKREADVKGKGKVEEDDEEDEDEDDDEESSGDEDDDDDDDDEDDDDEESSGDEDDDDDDDDDDDEEEEEDDDVVAPSRKRRSSTGAGNEDDDDDDVVAPSRKRRGHGNHVDEDEGDDDSDFAP